MRFALAHECRPTVSSRLCYYDNLTAFRLVVTSTVPTETQFTAAVRFVLLGTGSPRRASECNHRASGSACVVAAVIISKCVSTETVQVLIPLPLLLSLLLLLLPPAAERWNDKEKKNNNNKTRNIVARARRYNIYYAPTTPRRNNVIIVRFDCSVYRKSWCVIRPVQNMAVVVVFILFIL